ncbi:MAG: hypothetical protein NC300_12490 [Bacteroidales bacterium]|nr:hypothetical protein [Clostridium sp.]MCM1204952.1 hypothetical protein [Bacteroidales bacterium]
MEQKEEIENRELFMPAGLKLKKEYFQGFGKDELIPTIVSAFVFLIMDALLYLAGIRNVTLLLFLPFMGTSTVAMLQIKGELNLSPLDIINLEIRFAKSQKYYPYRAKNEWENID